MRGGGWNAENSQVSDGRAVQGRPVTRGHQHTTWTQERVALLLELNEEGLSAASIARELGGGVSRNAVIGKLDRLGVGLKNGARLAAIPAKSLAERKARRAEARAYHTKKLKAPKPNEQRRAATIKALKVSKGFSIGGPRVEAELIHDLPADQSDHAISFHKVREHHCRWPLGDPSDLTAFRFCGDQKGEGPYCARHARAAYRR